ncbi:DNA adenine methylase [Candidatus Nomurabacteria bacterium]|nr:DNA adenine methylase [Candidatus Nomurabacteria bacterium]
MTTQQLIKKLEQEFDINAIFAQHVLLYTKGKFDPKKTQELIDEKAKPFVKWVGGKRQLLKQFRKLGLYPPEGFDASKNTYFEPFVGGGAVFFDLLPQKAMLSDMNKELVTTYNVIKNNVEELIQSLKKHKHNKEYFLKIRAQKVQNLSEVEIASRFIFLNRTCFNGMYRVNSSGEFNVPFGDNKNPLICDEENLRKVSLALKKVSIKHQDYKAVLQKAKKGDFIYFDPPYYPVSKTASFTGYTKDAFLDKEQIELRDTFFELHKRGCFVMLSNSDTPFINKIYSELKDKKITINIVEAGRAINSKGTGRGKITEVLVTNY